MRRRILDNKRTAKSLHLLIATNNQTNAGAIHKGNLLKIEEEGLRLLEENRLVDGKAEVFCGMMVNFAIQMSGEEWRMGFEGNHRNGEAPFFGDMM